MFQQKIFFIINEPGFLDVSARFFLLTSELRSDDLPTFDLPISANSGKPSEGQSAVRALLLTYSALATCESRAYGPKTMLDPVRTRLWADLASPERLVSGGTKSFWRGSVIGF